MKTRRNLIAATALMAMLAGCTTNPYTGESQAGKLASMAASALRPVR